MIHVEDEDRQPQDVEGSESDTAPHANDSVAWALRDLERKLDEIEGAIDAILRSRPDLKKWHRRRPRSS